AAGLLLGEVDDIERSLRVGVRGDRDAGGDGAEQRDLHGAAAARALAVQQLDGARDLAVAADEAALLEALEVVVHDRGGRDVAARLNVTDRRRVVVIRNECLEELEDRLLLLGKRFRHGGLPPPRAAALLPAAAVPLPYHCPHGART